MTPPSRPAPWIVRSISTEFGRRHVTGVAITRVVVAVAAVIAGSVLCVRGQWWGALLLVPAALNGWFAYLMPRWRRALDELKSGPRVRELERSRALVVDDAAARLRRIEQDLHDGAQAQLVAVVMKLGLARDHLATAAAGRGQADLARGLELVDAAHRGAMEAISELRDLAHGIHPPALAEGLGAALAALAARSGLPVELVLDLPERPSAAIEVIAYFCAAELVTNAAKHSGAAHVRLEMTHRRGVVRLRVRDDGGGGARIGAGGGLAGLAGRVKTVDGSLHLASPAGGPTVITIELPSRA